MGEESALEHASGTAGAAGWLPLVVLPGCAAALYERAPAWAFMWTLAAAIYAGLKWMSWWRARGAVPHTAVRSAAYLLAWPGMDAEAFLDARVRVARPATGEWAAALAKTALGAVLLWVVARRAAGVPLAAGWMGMVGLILLLHFGSFHVASLVWRTAGVDAQPIMAAPLRATSLAEFWGKRWNLGFRQLAHEFVFHPLHRVMGTAGASFVVFVLSGLIHDLVISVPARGGYGLPTAYFVLQGLGVAAERSPLGRRLGLGAGVRGRLFMAVVTAAPAYWLFHPSFVLRVMVPFMKEVHAL